MDGLLNDIGTTVLGQMTTKPCKLATRVSILQSPSLALVQMLCTKSVGLRH